MAVRAYTPAELANEFAPLLSAIDDERLHDATGDPADIAYGQAIDDVLRAVQAVLSRAAVEPGKDG